MLQWISLDNGEHYIIAGSKRRMLSKQRSCWTSLISNMKWLVFMKKMKVSIQRVKLYLVQIIMLVYTGCVINIGKNLSVELNFFNQKCYLNIDWCYLCCCTCSRMLQKNNINNIMVVTRNFILSKYKMMLFVLLLTCKSQNCGDVTCILYTLHSDDDVCGYGDHDARGQDVYGCQQLSLCTILV